MTQEIKHFEIKAYETHGVKVCVQIDYDNKMVSLVEEEKGSIPRKYRTKQWVFANREIGYMEGWQNILKAMAYAVGEATRALKAHVDAEEKAKVRMHIRVAKAVAKDKK